MSESTEIFWRSPMKPLEIRALRGKSQGSLLSILMVFCIWICTHTQKIPAFSFADADPAAAIQDLLAKGNSAMQNSQWQHAEKCFDQALLGANDTQKGEIHQLLEWSQVNSMVERRHMDGSISRYIESLKPEDSQKLLGNIIALISENYYGPLDLNRISHLSLLQLQASVENSHLSSFPATDPQGFRKLTETIRSLSQGDSYPGDSGWDRFLTLEENLRNSSQETGLRNSWPAVELSYALANSLDKYSYLLSPDQYQTMLDQLGGFYVGVGIDLLFEGDYPALFDVIPNSPAEAQGLLPGDLLIEAAGVDLKNLSSAQVKKLLAGEPGSSLSVTVYRDQKKFPCQLTHDLIDAPSIRYVKLLTSGIGYLRIAGFDYDTALEMQKSIQKLEKSGAQSLILDLRSNGGGIMTAAIDAVRLFMDQGTIVTVHTASDKTEYQAGGDPFTCFDLPVVLLVDKNTASAAEIFAAALKDHHRAFLIGEKTFGKGVVQTIFQLPHTPVALCLTTACFIPPSQKSFHETGITPDILVKMPDNGIKNAFPSTSEPFVEDPVLYKGICLLNREKDISKTAISSTLQ